MMFFPFDTSEYRAMVFLDVETTGLDYQQDQITQFAARRVHMDSTCASLNIYIKIKDNVNYSQDVQQITLLSEEFLHENGIREGVAANKIFDFLFFAEPVVLIAHNAQFDMMFVLELFKRYGYTMPVQYSVLDTITVARDRKPFPHKLSDLMQHYNHKTEEELHRADTDVGVLINVFYSMLHEKNDINCYLDVIGIPPKKHLMGYCLPTIKYHVQEWFHYGRPHYPLYERGSI